MIKRSSWRGSLKSKMAIRNQKNFELRLGRQGILLFVTGMSVLLFAVFIFGIMVGIHIDAYPEKIAQILPAIISRQLHHPPATAEKIVVVREETKVPPAAEASIAVAPLPDPFVAKEDLPKETAGGEEMKADLAVTPAAVGKTPGTPPIPVAVKEQRAPVKPSVNVPVEKNPVSNARPPASKADAGDSASIAGRKYLVQVASFKSQHAAKQFSNKIKPLGFKPRVAMVELPQKGKWFRVIIDGFVSRDEAKKAIGVLEKNIKGLNSVVSTVK